LLFTQAFSAIGNIPTFKLLTGTSSYVTFFTAAVIIQTITSSALSTGLGLVTDFDSGFMDKMRVAPISKSSILFGRLFSAALTTILQVIIILIIGFALGVSIASGVLGIVIILILAALFGIAWSGISLFVALTTKNQETTLSVGLLTTFPLLFLSASVMPLGLLPDWVQQVAKVNPFTYVAQAFQSLIINGFALLLSHIFINAGMEVFEQADDPMNLVWVFITVLGMTIIILLIAKFWKKLGRSGFV
jgi:ABC-2 type transport system permease protein